MDNTAIETIAKLAHTADLKLLQEGYPAVVIPDGYKLQRTEELQAKPDFFRAAYKTSVLAEFIAYINQHGSAKTGVFINPDDMAARAIIDLGAHDQPEWGKHRATAALQRTPAYTALLKNADNTLLQQDFIDFVEDWAEHIEFYFDDGEVADAASAAKTLRRLKVNAKAEQEQTVGNFAASRSALESIEIRAGYEKLPEGFRFTAVPYDGFASYTFNCQLRAVSDDKNVKLKYRIGQLELIKQSIADEFRTLISAGIDTEGLAIFIGDMDYQK